MEKILGEKYELREIVGSGGSGTVWKAYDCHLGRYVAIKEFGKETSEADWEVEMLKELQHPVLPAILDYVKGEETSFLVMEYIDGVNLLDYIEENGRVEPEQAVKWALELTEVLVFLHERKRPVIYRDMKPANIMIERNGKVRLIDFGTVCFRYDEECTYKVAGTGGYAAPEQLEAAGVKNIDEKCDIYGLGTTLFHMLTGCNPSMPPFLIQPLRYYDRRLSIGLEKIIKKATAVEKEKRYTSVRRLQQELKQYKEMDKLRNGISKVAAMVYYVCLAGGTCHFLQCWEKAERYLASAGRLYIVPPGSDLPGIVIPCMAQKQISEMQMLIYASLLLVLCIGKCILERWSNRGIHAMRQERNIILTEKKNVGSFWWFLPVLLAVCMLTGGEASAKEENTLFVNVRNEKGQKLLIRYDTEYPLTDTLRLELPMDNFEAGERYELRLDCTNRKTGDSQSRIFYLKGLEP